MKKALALSSLLALLAVGDSLGAGQTPCNSNQGGTQFKAESGCTINVDAGTLTIGTSATLNLDGTAVTASGAEINLLDGTVAGTAVASKALALDSNKAADVISAVTLYLGTSGSGTALNSSAAAEINALPNMVTGASINVSAEFSDSITVTVQLYEADGTDVDAVSCVDVFFSTAAAGTDFSTPDTAPTIGTDGSLEALGNSSYVMCSETDGDIDFNIGYSGNVSRYFAVRTALGTIVVSGVLDFN